MDVLAFSEEELCGVADKRGMALRKKARIQTGLFFVFLTLLIVICPETRTGYSFFIRGKQLA